MLNKLRWNDARKAVPIESRPAAETVSRLSSYWRNMNSNMQKMSTKRDIDNNTESDVSSARNRNRLPGPDLYTTATEAFDDTTKYSQSDMEKMRKELDTAKSIISQQQRELEETRNFKHTMEQALPNPSEAEFSRGDHQITTLQR